MYMEEMSRTEKLFIGVFNIITIGVMVASSWFAFHRGPWKLNDEPGVWLLVFIGAFYMYLSNRSDEGEVKRLGKKGFIAMSIGLFMALFGGANAFSYCYACSPELRGIFYGMFVVGSMMFIHYDIKTYSTNSNNKKNIDKSIFK